MRVFRIKTDIDNCCFLLNIKPLKDFSDGYLYFDRLRNDWQGLELYIHSFKKPYASFNYFRADALFLSNDVAKILNEYLKKYGQLLPFTIERKGAAFIFNAANYLDCMTPEANHYKDKYLFYRDKINFPIFKITDHPFGPLFCTSGLFVPSEEFYHIYHDNNMTGLKFIEIEAIV